MSRILHIGNHALTLSDVEQTQHSVSFQIDGTLYNFQLEHMKDGNFILTQSISEGVSKRQAVAATRTVNGALRVLLASQEILVSEPIKGRSSAQEEKPLSPRAPMPGLVRQVLVKIGDTVTNGQPLIVMEAMKLQMTLAAGGDGIVERIAVQEGAMVEEGVELVLIAQKRT